MKTLQIRDIDDNIDRAAEKVFKQLGISKSAGIKMYLNQVAVTGTVPF
jgi:addiction module RelB/DinJ family antitoxin